MGSIADLNELLRHVLVLFPARSAGEIGEALVTQLEVAIQATRKDAFSQLRQLLCFVH